ncbi:tetratricopeptide repeat protein [Streptomyces sp. Qhu-G9]|uniref:tetratricopeptide repeat protein n=1 Tax=Streptomyces sp. Qhu-G9 TaxID=3452799 RepID=UPI0022AC44B1|nr:tetratricopeptide repeat protein [Streptomyces aurantiacus]WAU82394.1 tetratricopeptide repeat protein [Streptomyces aurantiacus]
MAVEPSGDGDVHAEVSGGRQDVVVTARDITGPVTITTAGVRVPGYLQDPRRWPLVKTWDALTAGAHRARPDDAGDAVPPYVARDVDMMLQTRLAQAAQRGGLVLVVGESTAGKTRAVHQAVRRCQALDGYRVLAPDTGPDLVIAVDVVATTLVRCVVWLDDLERFLSPDGLEPGVLAELVRLQTPVLATMQLRHYDTFYPHTAETRPEGPAGPQTAAVGTGARVLKQTEPLYLERRWSTEELARAKDCDDSRIIDAVTHHGPYGVAEYLAAGPALLTEWRHAARPGGHPRGAALVAAAVDLTRTGLRPPYPTSLLTTLHQHYLPDGHLLRPEPLDQALAWTQRLRYGATSLLLPTSNPDTWNVFDYLPDHTTTPVTQQAWQTALDHAADEDERFTIGVHAFDRAPHIAEAAWRPLAPHSPGAAFNLGILLSDAGRVEEAEQLYRQAMNAGHTDSAFNLGNLLADAGRVEEAEQLYRQAVDAGHTNAANNLGILLTRAGRVEEAEQLYRQASIAGNTDAAYNLGKLLADAGRVEEAEQLYRYASIAGNTNAANNLGILLSDARMEEAEKLFRHAMNAGHTDAANNLGILLTRVGRVEEAEQAYRQAVDAGNTNAAYNLGKLLADAGRDEEAEKLYRQAMNTGDTDAANNLGNLLARAGRVEEAEQAYRRAVDAGNTDAANNLGNLLARAGRDEEAEQAYRQATDAGNTRSGT